MGRSLACVNSFRVLRGMLGIKRNGPHMVFWQGKGTCGFLGWLNRKGM